MMYKPVLNQSDVRIADQKTVYQGFYQVQKLKLQHRLFQGGWSKLLHRELVVRLPAVAGTYVRCHHRSSGIN